MTSKNKHKIINDPVYGFISIPSDLIYELVEHPYFQRLRRIKQLGLTNYVYPGATHTRFQHALGSLHLMSLAIQTIREKGHEITQEEAKAVSAAILLHDIGHGPFSHALEYSIIEHITHEDISGIYMEYLNKRFNGKLDMAIEIFKGDYKKKFLHQLVSGQIDMDRLDYLRRDSFFSGVVEGSVSFDRIIKMLNVTKGNLVVEAKGIYSIEKFLIARRFMYWQVYMHKTVIAGEQLLVNILKRAKTLADDGVELFATPSLKFFLYNHVNRETLFSANPRFNKEEVLNHFSNLDDNDIISCARVWADHPDFTLSYLCKGIINRQLYKIEISNNPFPEQRIEEMRKRIKLRYSLSEDVINYFVFTLSVSANTYNPEEEEIRILNKSGRLNDLTDVSEMLKISALKKTEKKYILCYKEGIVESL